MRTLESPAQLRRFVSHGKTAALPIALMAPLLACGNPQEVPADGTATTPVATTDAAELALAENRDFVNISGAVVTTSPQSFRLDYGQGEVTVEMDDWDFYQEGRALQPGDEVTVSGQVDNNFYASRTIEADSVFVEDLNTVFYATSADEEQLGIGGAYWANRPGTIDYTGWVMSTDGRRFTMGSGSSKVTVDTSQLSYNPMDNEGYPRIETGDRVFVWGDFTISPDGQSTFDAEGLVSLTPGNSAEGQQGS